MQSGGEINVHDPVNKEPTNDVDETVVDDVETMSSLDRWAEFYASLMSNEPRRQMYSSIINETPTNLILDTYQLRQVWNIYEPAKKFIRRVLAAQVCRDWAMWKRKSRITTPLYRRNVVGSLLDLHENQPEYLKVCICVLQVIDFFCLCTASLKQHASGYGGTGSGQARDGRC